jgi:hypothetical protein
MAETKRMTAEQVVSYLLEEDGVDFLRESLRWVVQELMEVEVSELIGAEHGERSEERLTHRNGYRPRRWDTRAGEIELAIPKIRRGSYTASFLEPRRRSEQALVAVIQQAYVCGVSTRKVDQLVESLGLRISRSEVSRICAGLDEQVDAFRTRPLEGRYPVGAENPELVPGRTRLTATVVLGTTEPESPTSTSSSVYTVTAVYGGERALRLRSAGRLAVGRTTSCIGSTRTSVS